VRVAINMEITALLCVVAGFRRDVNMDFTLRGCYAA